MSTMLPNRTVTGHELTPQTVSLDESADVFEALAGETTRQVLRQLYEEPQTTGEVAETIGTSIQNTVYHIEKLEKAGLVSAVDTWYSPKGREMDVYAPCHQPLLMIIDNDNEAIATEE